MKRLLPFLSSSFTLLLLFSLTFLFVGTSSAAPKTLNSPSGAAPFSIPGAANAALVSKKWYFAEGFTGGSFTEYLTIANPNTSATTVTVNYLLQGASPITRSYQVQASSRFTLNVDNEVGKNKTLSMVVTGSQPIIAERPMYFTYTGLPGYTIPGGSDVLGATSLATNFDFGYLDTTRGHDTYLTILNQNLSSITATIRYFSANGGAPLIRTHQIAATSRGTVHVNADGLPAGTYSALVTLSAPGLVERPLYLKDSSTGYTGAADVVGVAQPQTDWYFAEGFISSVFQERYIVANPSTTTSAHVTLTFFLSGGAPKTTSLTLAPGQQRIFTVGSLLSGNNSGHVQADQPILAERFMSFKYLGRIPGASDVLGAAAPSTQFYFAEGFTGGQFSEYLTIENPDASRTATAQVTFLPSNGGASQTHAYTIAPSSRFTLNTASVMPNQSFSMTVASDIAIVVERPMYFVYGGSQTGGSDVIGYQPPASPPAAGLSVYVSSAQSDSVYALDASTGAIRWKFPTGSAVVSSPAVVNGVVYFGSDDDYVYAVNASDGSLLWRFQTGFVIQSSPVVDNGVVYIGSEDKYLYALDAATGTQIWRFFTNDLIESTVAVGNGMVYVGSGGAIVWALNTSDGSKVWQSFSEGPIEARLLLDNGILYVPTFGGLEAFNATTGAGIFKDAQIGALSSSPTIVNGILYIGDDQDTVYAVNPITGAILWTAKSGESSPAVVNGIVYIGAIDHNVYAFNAQTGDLLWRYLTGDQVLSGPTVVDGIVYIGSVDGFLYALDANDGTLFWRTQTGGGIVCVPAIAP